ncbi:hypothetical protein EDC94DRAFT_518275 [Helicostylum pulchrum]|nr:hypothetical protein EDC94DRAFT_518275 [Helicostylum pulchrum]
MFDKAVRLAKCLKQQTTEKVIVQDEPCNDAPCRGCEAEEACSFLGLRGFKVSKKTGKLLHGPYFPSTNNSSPLQRLKSLCFNTKPPTKKSPSYAMNKIKSTFHNILVKQKGALSKNGLNTPIRRENPEGYRHFCDSCYNSLFNYHFVCSTCALEICPDCYDKFTTLTSDDPLFDCVKGDTHVKEEFVVVSKLPEDEMEELIQATDSKYTNQPNNQQPSSSDINNTSSRANIQCIYNNEKDTNKSSSTGNIRILIFHTSLILSPVPTSSSLSTTPALSQTPQPSQPAASMLHISARDLTPESFNAHWQTHQPAMVSESTTGSRMNWTPEMFENLCAQETLEATDLDGTKFEVSGKDYFAAFSDRAKRKELCSALNSTQVLKVKDLPPNKSLKAEYPRLYQDFMNTLVTPEYCTADGYFNLANRLPEEYLPPDLGPKLFISYGSDESGKTGKTNLHCDMTDAVNVMYYADDNTSESVPVASALWHIFPYESFEKVCSYIAGHKEVGPLHPILDHAFYLDAEDLKALERKYDVVPFTLYQNPGDTVYIPAGCAHQVTNYSNSIKCAYDFISPENVDRSVYISECFRHLKKEDKLQIATTLAFAWTSLKADQV